MLKTRGVLGVVLVWLYVLRAGAETRPYGFNLCLIEPVGANIIRPFCFKSLSLLPTAKSSSLYKGAFRVIL